MLCENPNIIAQLLRCADICSDLIENEWRQNWLQSGSHFGGVIVDTHSEQAH